MLLLSQQLLGLRAVTTSGTTLGHVVDVTVETETQSILQYHVKKDLALSKGVRAVLSREIFLIHREQVVSISEKELVAHDSVLEVLEKANVRSVSTFVRAAEPITFVREE